MCMKDKVELLGVIFDKQINFLDYARHVTAQSEKKEVDFKTTEWNFI